MTEKHRHQFREGKSGSAISVRVIPRSSRNEVIEIQSDGTVRIRLTAPPVDGKANDGLIDFLAEILEVPRSAVEIISGMTGHSKLVSIIGRSPDEVTKRLMDLIQKP